MKTMLFCTSYAPTEEAWNDRQQRWIDHHKPMDLGDLWLFDDGSLTYRENPDVNFYRFEDNLGRQSHLEYPGWWRSFKEAYWVAEKLKYDKIIHVESDTFILTRRLRDYLASLTEGWTVLYSNMYSFPETQIQVICKDQFPAFKKVAETPYGDLKGKHAEHVLPFTNVVIGGFNGDRWPEQGVKVLPSDADYACAVPPTTDIWYR